MTVPPPATLMKPARDSTPVVLGPNLPTLVVGIFTHGYEYNPAVQRIRNEWGGEAVFGRLEELQSSALTLQRDSSRWAAIFFDMTYLIDARFGPGSDPVRRQSIIDEQNENKNQVGTNPRILAVLIIEHSEFIHH